VGGSTIGEDEDGPDFLIYALCYSEEEGITATDYTVRSTEDIEEEMFNFVNEEETFEFLNKNEEEDSKGSVESIDDIDYPLADEPMNEIALNEMKFPSSMKLLFDQNMGIADTRATVHATLNPISMVKKSEKKCNDSVTIGNGKIESTEWYIDSHVTLCDIEGNVK
jgi:hypothetical protein